MGMEYAKREAQAHSVQGRTDSGLNMKYGKEMAETKKEKRSGNYVR